MITNFRSFHAPVKISTQISKQFALSQDQFDEMHKHKMGTPEQNDDVNHAVAHPGLSFGGVGKDNSVLI